jgi:hypothetical protein
MTVEISQSDVNSLIRQYISLPCTQAKKGHGSFITLDFGELSEVSKRDGSKYLKGHYHLWIYMCRWKLFNDSKYELNSEQISQDRESILSGFLGGSLELIEEGNDCKIYIQVAERKLVLSMDEDAGLDADYFMLFMPNGSIISYSPASKFKLEVE